MTRKEKLCLYFLLPLTWRNEIQISSVQMPISIEQHLEEWVKCKLLNLLLFLHVPDTWVTLHLSSSSAIQLTAAVEPTQSQLSAVFSFRYISANWVLFFMCLLKLALTHKKYPCWPWRWYETFCREHKFYLGFFIKVLFLAFFPIKEGSRQHEVRNKIKEVNIKYQLNPLKLGRDE